MKIIISLLSSCLQETTQRFNKFHPTFIQAAKQSSPYHRYPDSWTEVHNLPNKHKPTLTYSCKGLSSAGFKREVCLQRSWFKQNNAQTLDTC